MLQLSLLLMAYKLATLLMELAQSRYSGASVVSARELAYVNSDIMGATFDAATHTSVQSSLGVPLLRDAEDEPEICIQQRDWIIPEDLVRQEAAAELPAANCFESLCRAVTAF